MRIRTFVDAVPVDVLAVVGTSVVTGSPDGVDRFAGSNRTHWGEVDGLLGNEVVALGADSARKMLWVATKKGVTKVSLSAGTLTPIAEPPESLNVGSTARSALAATGGGGVWLGTDHGLFRISSDGTWSSGGVAEPITSLMRDRQGVLWVGGPAGLRARARNGTTKRYGPKQGCDLTAVRFLSRDPRGGILAVGTNAAGDQRIVMMIEGRCASFRMSPEEEWRGAYAAGNEVAILGERKAYLLSAQGGSTRRLARDDVRLTRAPADGYNHAPDSPFLLRAVDRRLPSGARSIALRGSEMLIGTRDLGTQRVPLSKGPSGKWFRRRSFTRKGRRLSVTCETREKCLLATGTGQLWEFDGERFVLAKDAPIGVDTLGRSPQGTIYALHRVDDAFAVSRKTETGWELLPPAKIALEQGRTEITFAEFSPAGILWLGLAYRDGKELRPQGVALVDVEMAAVSYHRVTSDANQRQAGILPIPIGTRDVCFLGEEEVWLATSQGAARLKGTQIRTFGEADGLESELLSGVACSSGGLLFVASSLGIATYDGNAWQFPRPLRGRANDIDIGPDGRLWMATTRGLAAFDGAKVRRLDVRRGLAENNVRNLLLDQFGRVWLRGDESITVVVP